MDFKSNFEVKQLTRRLENLVFQAMQDPKDKLFSSELAKLIKDAKKLGKDGLTNKSCFLKLADNLS